MAYWVTDLPRNTEDVDLNAGIGRYILAEMTTCNRTPLSLGPISNGRLKNLRDIDKRSSLYLCLSGQCQSLESLGCTGPVQIGQRALTVL